MGIISKVVTSQPVVPENESTEISEILNGTTTTEQVDVNSTLSVQNELEENISEAIEEKSSIFKIALFFLVFLNVGLVLYLCFRKRKNVKKPKKQYERIRNKEQNVKEHLICNIKGQEKAKNSNKGHPGYTSEMDDDDLLDLIDKETKVNGFPLYQNIDEICEKPMSSISGHPGYSLY